MLTQVAALHTALNSVCMLLLTIGGQDVLLLIHVNSRTTSTRLEAHSVWVLSSCIPNIEGARPSHHYLTRLGLLTTAHDFECLKLRTSKEVFCKLILVGVE